MEENNKDTINKMDNIVENKITKDMIIAEIVERFPYLAEYIMDYGVHCVGCGVASFETLEEGFMGHGLTSEEIDIILEELNKIIRETEG